MIQNKLEKFLAVASSLLLAVAVVMGIKIQEDSKKLSAFENNLSDSNANLLSILETQRQIMSSREATLDKLSTVAAPDTTRAVITRTVVPGKVVQQKVPVSSKTTKTS